MAHNHNANLPPAARAKLTVPIHDAVDRPFALKGPHTLPVSAKSWQHYASLLDAEISRLQEHVSKPPEDSNSFASLGVWIKEILDLRTNVISLILALRPFEPFQEYQAEEMMGNVDRVVRRVAAVVEVGEPLTLLSALDPLPVTNWASIEHDHPEEPLLRAFGVSSIDLCDDNGEFAPSRVFVPYEYQNHKLAEIVLPHLLSMGLPPITDLLAAVNVVGWVESATDEIGAYCATNSLFNKLLAKPNQAAIVTALNHLEERDYRLRQSRNRANRSFNTRRQETDLELAAMDMAEGYKRLLEGPVRQYGWLHHCIEVGEWSNPPMLTGLREILINDGGWLADVAGRMMLTEVRNAEAHETLLWDGINEVFVTEDGHVDAGVVHSAVITADAFARGSQAAVACYRALSITPKPGGPVATDPGRSSPWLRAEAFFGTNGLHVLKTNFNSKVARITVTNLSLKKINPCFQALLCCYALLPAVQRFEIYAQGTEAAVLTVSADALRRTHPIWEGAIDQFRLLPFSTFLPANLDARSKLESPLKAVRSVSRIALEDLLDALDSSPEELHAEDLAFLAERVDLVASATKECLTSVLPEHETRLRAAHSVAAELSKELRRLQAPVQLNSLDETTWVIEARRIWTLCGPAPRLPGFPESSETAMAEEAQERRLRSDEDRNELRFRTI